MRICKNRLARRPTARERGRALLALVAACALSAMSLPAQAHWKPGEAWPERMGHAAAYDATRQRVVLFGGWLYNGSGYYNGRTELNDTWEWDGKVWRRVTPKTSPPARFGHSMVTDPKTGHVLLFGGAMGYFDWTRRVALYRYFNDTWIFDGQDWRQMRPKTSPPARVWFGMASDRVRRRAVVFGGNNNILGGLFGLGFFNDTWEWDGTNWIAMSPVHRPSARDALAMAYCVPRKSIVMFGGTKGFFYPPARTWFWDGKDWSSIAPSPSSLKSRWGHGMTTHPVRGTPVMFSGAAARASLKPNVDLLEFDGKSWAKLSPTLQPAIGGQGDWIVADVARKAIVLPCRRDVRTQISLTDTWVFKSGNWTKVWGSDLPADFSAFASGYRVVHDEARDRFLLFGHAKSSGYSKLRIFALRQHRFVDVTPIGGPLRTWFSVAYHPGIGKTILFGGGNGLARYLDTWLFDGTSWVQHKVGKPPTEGGTLVYNGRRDKMMSFGGTHVWEWDVKSGWTQGPSMKVPEPGRIAYDPVRDRAVLVGTNATPTKQNRVHEWDGSKWAQVVTKTQLPARVTALVTYIPELGGVVVYGGYTWRKDGSGVGAASTWLYDGKDWRKLATNPLTNLGEDWPSIGVYDSGRKRLRTFYDPDTYFDFEVSHLSTPLAYPRPGQQTRLDAVFPADPSALCFVGLSESLWPGVPLRKVPYGGTEIFPVAPTPLLLATLSGKVLDAAGKASWAVPVPNLSSLVGFEAHAAGFTLGTGGVRTVSNEVPFRVIR